MSHFYGVVAGNRGQATRGGTKISGYLTIAASWDGAIQVRLSYDKETEKNHYVVYQSQWHGKGIEQPIASGIIGEVRDHAEYHRGYKDGYDHGEANGYDTGYKDAIARFDEAMKSLEDA
jgi:hypothetical protein